MKTITVLIPAYNEEAVLPQLFARLKDLQKMIKKYRLELLFINDGSSDDTLTMIQREAKKNSSIAYVNLSRNFGKEAGMLAGFDYAKGDAVVIIDADLQDPPELIPQMIELWEQGYDDVYARRRSRQGETWLKKKTSEWYYRILQKSTRIPIQRATGDTKRNYNKLINLAIDSITSFTITLLRISSILGLIISYCAFIYILYLLIRPLFGIPTGTGYSSLMAVILFLSGIQLISLGIIGEYRGQA